MDNIKIHMNGKTLLALIGGLAAGAAIGAYLSSEKGSKVRANLDEVLNDLGKELNGLLSGGKEKLNEVANDFKSGGDALKKQFQSTGNSGKS